MIIKKTFKPGSLTWLEERAKCITSTEVASLFGLNKYKSVNALIKDKQNPQPIWSIAIRRGRIMEPSVRQAVIEDLGWKVTQNFNKDFFSFTQVDGLINLYTTVAGLVEIESLCKELNRILWKAKELDRSDIYFYRAEDVALSATPDAVKLTENGEFEALVELKSANEKALAQWAFTPPVNYILQVHAQMMCTDLHKAYIAGLGAFDPFPLIVYEVRWNDWIARVIKDEVNRFWEMLNEGLTFEVDKNKKKDIKEWCLQGVKRIY